MVVIFWVSAQCRSSVSEKCTASIFRVTELVLMDSEMMVWTNMCWLFRNLANHIDRRQQKRGWACPEPVGVENFKNGLFQRLAQWDIWKECGQAPVMWTCWMYSAGQCSLVGCFERADEPEGIGNFFSSCMSQYAVSWHWNSLHRMRI
jgi:hypothetical protein